VAPTRRPGQGSPDKDAHLIWSDAVAFSEGLQSTMLCRGQQA
jgi:hypothetical protein